MPAFVLACLAFLCSTALAAEERAIEWQASYDAALEEATRRGVPLLIMILEDGEEASEDILANLLPAKELVAASEHTVNLLANPGDEKTHREVETGPEGNRTRLCGKYGGVSCLAHRTIMQRVFRDFARDGMLKTPTSLFVLPDLTIVTQLIDKHPIEAYLEAFEAAEARSPGGLTRTEAAELREAVAAAKQITGAAEPQDAIRRLRPFAERTSSALLVDEAKAEYERIVAAGKEALAAVERQIEAKDYAPAMAALEELAKNYRGCPVETLARERHATLAKNRTVKAALLATKREENARKLLVQADALLAGGDAERAERLYTNLREKFGETAAARELAARTSSPR